MFFASDFMNIYQYLTCYINSSLIGSLVLDTPTVVGIAFAAFVIGALLTGALWFIYSHTGESRPMVPHQRAHTLTHLTWTFTVHAFLAAGYRRLSSCQNRKWGNVPILIMEKATQC